MMLKIRFSKYLSATQKITSNSLYSSFVKVKFDVEFKKTPMSSLLSFTVCSQGLHYFFGLSSLPPDSETNFSKYW